MEEDYYERRLMIRHYWQNEMLIKDHLPGNSVGYNSKSVSNTSAEEKFKQSTDRLIFDSLDRCPT